ncbi:MAG: YIP1 family protein [Treponema sp.]|jgi:hypothetical protein|nr:YIP1 family protein [Treponema sp.]
MNLKTFAGDLRFLRYTLTHPFDGFYELRFRRSRNWILIALIYALCGITKLFKTYYSGFLLNGGLVYGVNNWYVIAAALFPYFLFALANWSVTTLFDGSGSLSDVLEVLAYAQVPKLFFDIAYIIASNFITGEELILLNALYAAGILLFAFLVFAGLCVVHEYGAAKNIITIIATAAAAVTIVFIGMLYLEIMGKIISFAAAIIAELTKRR